MALSAAKPNFFILANRAMNWVGGVTTPEAALSLLGQGGIPSTDMVSGGKISAIRLEHVWLEIYVDYIPSRAAVNKNPNTWGPVDASVKDTLRVTARERHAPQPFLAGDVDAAAHSGPVGLRRTAGAAGGLVAGNDAGHDAGGAAVDPDATAEGIAA